MLCRANSLALFELIFYIGQRGRLSVNSVMLGVRIGKRVISFEAWGIWVC